MNTSASCSGFLTDLPESALVEGSRIPGGAGVCTDLHRSMAEICPLQIYLLEKRRLDSHFFILIP